MQEIVRFLSLGDANVRYVLFGSVLLGLASGMIGTFTLLRKRSLIGDALAHATLPGVALGFLLTMSKTMYAIFIGAAISGILAVLTIIVIVNMTRIKEDTAIGITLSVFFGAGIVLLTYIQHLPTGNQSGLDKFLFGQAASILPQDIKFMSIIAIITVAMVVILFKEFRLLVFDAGFLASMGFPVIFLDILLMFLVVLVVMIGIQAVGVILMAALLITPAAGARFWTEDLKKMLIISSIFGAVSGVIGVFFSSLAPRIPTGPVMILSVTAFFAVSAIAAPGRGLLAKFLHQLKNKRKMNQEHILRAIIEWFELNPGKTQISLVDLALYFKKSEIWLKRQIRSIQRSGYIGKTKPHLELTGEGLARAVTIIKSHRLWEYYLLHRMSLEKDHVHRDADNIEHILSADMLDRLEKILEADGINTKNIISIHPLIYQHR